MALAPPMKAVPPEPTCQKVDVSEAHIRRPSVPEEETNDWAPTYGLADPRRWMPASPPPEGQTCSPSKPIRSAVLRERNSSSPNPALSVSCGLDSFQPITGMLPPHSFTFGLYEFRQ